MSDFNTKRRQQFLTEGNYISLSESLLNGIQLFTENPTGIGDTLEERWLYSFAEVADKTFDLLSLKYTAGEPILPLRQELEQVVVAYERYAEKLREYNNDPNAMAFPIMSYDGYCPYLWLISLCYLLQRRDLLPRVAKLVDGEDEENAGLDFNIEELLNYSDDLERYECEDVTGACYKIFSDALCEPNHNKQLDLLNKFLKNWYKDLASTPWHDSHKDGGGYYGYWAFEAAAAVILLEIEDDSSLHQYLYYPKDLVTFARTFNPAQHDDFVKNSPKQTNIQGGNPCPKSGYWFTPAKPNSRQYFNEGEIFPKYNELDWGVVYWQWDGEK